MTRRTADPPFEQQVDAAVRYARRATTAAPMAERRLARKLAERGHSEAVVDHALTLARRERLVDDAAFARAFTAERRAQGHAPLRIRRDLERREVGRDTIDAALAAAASEDQEAAAFDVALRRARNVGHVPAETAFRRVVGYLARRGYPEVLARKVARQAVFADRESDRVADR